MGFFSGTLLYRKELNEEMMMNVNGGLLIVDRDNPKSPDVGAPVVLEEEADEEKESRLLVKHMNTHKHTPSSMSWRLREGYSKG